MGKVRRGKEGRGEEGGWKSLRVRRIFEKGRRVGEWKGVLE